MTKNIASTGIKIKNEKAILIALKTGNLSVKEIENETKLSRETVRVHLAYLKKEDLVMIAPGNNRRKKIYALTSLGLLKLNELDNGLKAEFFLFQLQSALTGRIFMALAQDNRLPENEFSNIRDAVFDKLIPSIVNKDRKALDEYWTLVREIHSRYNISPPFQPHESNLNNLKLFAGEVILYIAARAAQDKNPEYLQLLQYLPTWYYDMIKSNAVDTDYIISNISIRKEIEYCLSAGQNLTLEDYKKFMGDIHKLKKHQENSEE